MSYTAIPRMTAIVGALISAVMNSTNAQLLASPFGVATEDEDPKRITAFPALVIRHTAETPDTPNEQKVSASVALDIYMKHAQPSEKANAARAQMDSLRKFIRTYQTAQGQGHFGAAAWIYTGWTKKSGVTETGESVDILTLNYQVKFTEDNL